MGKKFKRRQCKSIIAYVLCVIMALGLIPATSLKVRADGVVAILVDAGNGNPGKQIGNEAGYDTLQAAFTATEAFEDYTGVVLQKDVTVDADLTLNKTINLFLNGHTLTIESGKTLMATNNTIDIMNYTGSGEGNGTIVCNGTINSEVNTFSEDVDLNVSGGISTLKVCGGSVTITDGDFSSLEINSGAVEISGGQFGYAQIFDGTLDITGGAFGEFCQDGGRTEISGGEFKSAYSMNNMGSPTLTIMGSPSFENLRFEYYNGWIGDFDGNNVDSNTPTTETVIVKGSPLIKSFSVLIQAFENGFNLDGKWGSLTINGGYFGNDPSNSYYSGFDYDSENEVYVGIGCTDEEKTRITINVDKDKIEKYSDQKDWVENNETYQWRIVDPSYSSNVPVTGVTLNKSSLRLEVGGNATLNATVTPDDATDKTVTWSSDTEAVATVDNTGKITAVSAGTAAITATAGDKTATCIVTVSNPPQAAEYVASVSYNYAGDKSWDTVITANFVSVEDAFNALAYDLSTADGLAGFENLLSGDELTEYNNLTDAQKDKLTKSGNVPFVKLLKNTSLNTAITLPKSINMYLDGHNMEIGSAGAVSGADSDIYFYPSENSGSDDTFTNKGNLSVRDIEIFTAINFDVKGGTVDMIHFDCGNINISSGKVIGLHGSNPGSIDANINISGDAEVINICPSVDGNSSSSLKMTVSGNARIRNFDAIYYSEDTIKGKPNFVFSGGYFDENPLLYANKYTAVSKSNVDESKYNTYYIRANDTYSPFSDLSPEEQQNYINEGKTFYECKENYYAAFYEIGTSLEEYSDQTDWTADKTVYKWRIAGQPVCQHSNMTPVEVKDATCTEAGNDAYYICSDCGLYFSDEQGTQKIEKDSWIIEAKGHTPVDVPEEAAKCTTKGKTAGKKCSVCEEILEGIEDVDALGHNYEEVEGSAKAATCTAAGKEADKKCTRCNDVIEGEAVTELGHLWGDWEVITPATDTTDGERRRVCSRDPNHIETKPIPSLSHVHRFVKVDAKAATCTEAGNSEYYTCSDCGLYFSDEEGTQEIEKDSWVIAAKGHTPVDVQAVAPTCTEKGKTAGRKCSVCEEILEGVEDVEALGHNYEEVAGSAKAATCTEAGKEADKKCSRCENVIEGTAIEALGHNYEEVAGSAKAATCTEAGKEADKKCSRCENVIEGTAIEVLGHNYEEVAGSAKAATCTEEGKEADKKCTRCNDVIEGKAIAALGHNWDAWKTLKNPTEMEDGSEERVCKNDATHKETRAIEKLAVKPVTDNAAVTPVTDNAAVTPVTTTTPETPAVTGATVTDKTSGITYTVTSEAATGTDPSVEYKKSTGTDNQTDVTIPDSVTINGVEYKVTSVAEEAFKGNETITTVTIGNNIETISDGAFEGCKNLTGVTIPDSVTSLGDSAFAGCTSLKTATIGSAVEKIGVSTFAGCTSLKKIKIPDSVTEIGKNAFNGCRKLTNMNVGKNVKKVGDGAFSNCTSMKTVTLSSKTNTFGNQVFKGSKKLKTITIKSKKLTVKTLAKNAFKGVGGKVTIKVPKGKKKAYTELFRKKGLPKKVKIK